MQRSRPKALSTPLRRRGSVCASDIVPGAVFPASRAVGCIGQHRTLPELQEGDPLCGCSPTEISVQVDGRTTHSPPATQLRGRATTAM